MQASIVNCGVFSEEMPIESISLWDADDMKDQNHHPEANERSREIVDGYRLILEPARKGGYIGRSIEFPRTFARGKTDQECLANLRETLIEVVTAMLETNRVPPRPAEKRLTEQVNIRLTLEEKMRAEHLAQVAGCRGLADYVRSLLMRQLRA